MQEPCCQWGHGGLEGLKDAFLQRFYNPKIKVGSKVAGKPWHPLVCGSGAYQYAIVISIDPLILVSPQTDMRWSCVDERTIEVIGKASTWQVWWCKYKRGKD